MDKVGPTGLRVGRRLNELRGERGYTLSDVQERLAQLGRPISLSALSKIENGLRRVDADDLVALARALGVSPNALLLPGPTDTGTEVALTPKTTLDLDTAWRWAVQDQPPASTRPGVFVSYARPDRAWADWIARLLVREGHDVSIDAWDLDLATCVVPIVSKDYQRSRRNQEELRHALERAYPPVLAVYVDESVQPEGPLAQRRWIRLDNRTVREAQDALIDAIDELNLTRVEPQFPQVTGGVDAKLGNDRAPAHLAIVAVDIMGSTQLTNPAKAMMRRDGYTVFRAALRAAGITASDLIERGDGFLALIPPTVAKTLLLDMLIPRLSDLLDDRNSRMTGYPLRLRAVVHAGEVHFDRHGPFGGSIDLAARLLDAPELKTALQTTTAPLALVVSDDIYQGVVRHGYEGIDAQTFQPLVRVEIAGQSYRGWVQHPSGWVSP